MSYRENLFYGASPEIHRRAQELRKLMTPCEKILWERLKGKYFLGYKFRRQHPLYKYIVDFYCHQLKLVLEVDGSMHLGADAVEYDINRTTELEEFGLQVLRFSNDEVSFDTEHVMVVIKAKVEEIITR
jgi:very-short-patch-repair endonuclease